MPAKMSSECFGNIKVKLTNITQSKLKEGVTVEPQLKELIKNKIFIKTLDKIKPKAWESFKYICENGFGKKISQNFRSGVKCLLESFEGFTERMSLKSNFFIPIFFWQNKSWSIIGWVKEKLSSGRE